MKKTAPFVVIVSLMAFAACQTQKEAYYIKSPIPKQVRLAVLIKGKNEIKNAAYIEFLNAGYNLQGLNASDFYTIADVFDIKSYKKSVKAAALRKKDTKFTATLLDRAFDSIYKLHIYNFENSKADYIREMAKRWQIDYIVLISMKDWKKGYSWIRAINVNTLELTYVHNYRAGHSDSYQSILKRMIDTMLSGK